ncbi:MAG: hypothetical protein KIC65_09590 [Firmicutes bacterium]|nr:hypothetical protein [Bacillota bacterium]
MKLTKEECKEALSTIKYFDDIRLKDMFAPDNNIKDELDLISQLIDDYFQLEEEVRCLRHNEEIYLDMSDKQYSVGIFLYELLEKKGYTKKELNELIHEYQVNSELQKAVLTNENNHK